MERSSSWIVILIILLSSAAMAQTGSIAGSVADPSGAALQNVQITVRNLATNAVRVVASSLYSRIQSRTGDANRQITNSISLLPVRCLRPPAWTPA